MLLLIWYCVWWPTVWNTRLHHHWWANTHLWQETCSLVAQNKPRHILKGNTPALPNKVLKVIVCKIEITFGKRILERISIAWSPFGTVHAFCQSVVMTSFSSSSGVIRHMVFTSQWNLYANLSAYEQKRHSLKHIYPEGPESAKQLPSRWIGMLMDCFFQTSLSKHSDKQSNVENTTEPQCLPHSLGKSTYQCLVVSAL